MLEDFFLPVDGNNRPIQNPFHLKIGHYGTKNENKPNFKTVEMTFTVTMALLSLSDCVVCVL